MPRATRKNRPEREVRVRPTRPFDGLWLEVLRLAQEDLKTTWRAMARCPPRGSRQARGRPNEQARLCAKLYVDARRFFTDKRSALHDMVENVCMRNGFDISVAVRALEPWMQEPEAWRALVADAEQNFA